MEDTKTHRCIDCAQQEEHFQAELCPSCGRCVKHCHGATAGTPLTGALTHTSMTKIGS